MPLSGEGRQILSVLCVNLLSCSLGANMGWASSAMKFLESKETDLITGSLTPAESALINSMYPLGGLIGSLLYGYVCDKIGRRWALRTIVVPQLIAYVLIAYATTSMMILVSRIISGFAAGGLYIGIPLFVSEIAEDQIRGALGSLFILMSGLGLLFAYILGAFLKYNICVWPFMILPTLFAVLSILLKETPFHLLKKNQNKEAEDSMMFYRNVKKLKGNSYIEFESLKVFVKFSAVEEKVSWLDFRTKAAKKTIIIGVVMVALEQFCGCFALLFYAASTFEHSGATSITPEVATIIIGILQIVGAYCSSLLIDRLGRKILLITASFSIAFGMTLFGMATQLIEAGHNSTFMRILPVLALSVSILFANIGLFTLTFVILAEISPSKIKSYIFTMCMILSWTFSFTVFNLLPPLIYFWGQGGVMYFFAINSILGGLFAIFYLPETKGKSFGEIAEIMNR